MTARYLSRLIIIASRSILSCSKICQQVLDINICLYRVVCLIMVHDSAICYVYMSNPKFKTISGYWDNCSDKTSGRHYSYWVFDCLFARPPVTWRRFGRVTGANFFIVAMFSDAARIDRPVSAVMEAGTCGPVTGWSRVTRAEPGGHTTIRDVRPIIHQPRAWRGVPWQPGRALITGRFDYSLTRPRMTSAWDTHSSKTFDCSMNFFMPRLLSTEISTPVGPNVPIHPSFITPKQHVTIGSKIVSSLSVEFARNGRNKVYKFWSHLWRRISFIDVRE